MADKDTEQFNNKPTVPVLAHKTLDQDPDAGKKRRLMLALAGLGLLVCVVASVLGGLVFSNWLKQDETPVVEAGEKQTQTAQIIIPVAERLGDNVVDVEQLSKGYGDNLLIDDLTFKLPAGGIVGVIGPNGAGKTTLFRMITGQEKPDKGAITVGETVHLGYVDQSRDALDGKKSVWEEISNSQDVILLGKKEMNSNLAVVQL